MRLAPTVFPRRVLAVSPWAPRRARSVVVTDPEILDGDPVFRGTRRPEAALCRTGKSSPGVKRQKIYGKRGDGSQPDTVFHI